jgi:hypothetical protein
MTELLEWQHIQKIAGCMLCSAQQCVVILDMSAGLAFWAFWANL